MADSLQQSYLIIVDRATRYTWVILTKAKISQVDLISKFLAVHGSNSTTQRFIMTDEGGELWGSHNFQRMCRDSGFILQNTASDASFQNGMAERPNPHLRGYDVEYAKCCTAWS